MSMFRAKKLDLGCFYNIRTIRDHTKRKVFEQFEPERYAHPPARLEVVLSAEAMDVKDTVKLMKTFNRQALRYMIRNTTLSPRVRAEAQLQLAQMHCYTRPTQIRNRCIMGGQGRGVLSDFKMSRYQFRVQAMAGNIPGVKRASW
ncbi:hypothetical protein NQ176_g7907 [Zarea fungicola]|uniref:Uncharacterized protein n=1 Tax=Zarea fungicola TaxID=93591 RepID=A0ACC1MXM4_9HYPO|nr:hypothetical protein NQ176_g7907 [Lecanicillium fungicola]